MKGPISQLLRSKLRAHLPFEIASTFGIAALIYYAARKVDLNLLWTHLVQGVDRRILIAILLSVSIFLANGLRLKALIKSDFLTSYQIVNLGAVLNVVLPFRLGDVAKIYLSRRYYRVSGNDLLIATIIEKFVDLAVVLALAGIAVLCGGLGVVPLTAVLSLAAVLGSIFIGFQTFRKFKLLDRCVKVLPMSMREQVTLLFANLVDKDPYSISLLTGLIWVANVACTFASFHFLLPGLNFGILDAVALTVITGLAVAVPGAPAGMGIFEAGVVAYLTQVHHVSSELALATALIFHAVIVVPPLAGILVGMVRKFT